MEHDQRGQTDVDERVQVLKTIALLTGAAFVLGVVAVVVGEAVDGTGPSWLRERFDLPTLEFFADRRSPWLTTFMKAVTLLGGTPVSMSLLVVGAIASYVVTRRPRWPVFFVAVMLGANQLVLIVKPIVDRARPNVAPIYDTASKAFPSGHATAAAACFGALGLLCVARFRRPWSIVAGCVCGVLVLLVGVTRVYLGVHWPSDVIGGWGLGLAWVTVVRAATHPVAAAEEP